MKRTNIYLDEKQTAALDEISRRWGISRAELIRRLIGGAIGGSQSADLSADLAAIAESSGALGGEVDFLIRGADGRARHLDDVARR